jgi:O-antigen biosynthesis protein
VAAAAAFCPVAGLSGSMGAVSAEDASLLARRPGAPRLIEWTGERCVPWAPDPQVVYEHLHRYLWAAQLVGGRRVLDLASGEGFGAAILAPTAREVVGIEIDPQTVEHARLNYELPNLTFAVGDAQDLSRFDDGSFGAVVAFEMIEHVPEQEHMLDEIRRVLTPDGLLIVSTPDREVYRKASGENPFHVRELSRDEFAALLRSRFAHTAMWGQRTITGSALAALDDSASPATGRSFFVERAGEEWRVAPGISPLYMVAMAANAELPQIPADSTLGDCGIELVRHGERRIAQELGAVLAQRDIELDGLRQQLDGLRARAAHDAHTISTLDNALNDANARLARVEGSVTWQLFQKVRGRLFTTLGGEDSRGVEAVQGALRTVGRKLSLNGGVATSGSAPRRIARTRSRGGPIILPRVDDPDVSIVIPVYAHAELTRAALESIRDNTAGHRYEVIVVDDSEDVPTKALLRQVDGARVLVNDTNIGFIRSIHAGAAAARGRWLILANNDIEPQPGWLAAMLDCAESRSDIAIVSPKFLYPNGRLAEAGGIMWRDATGANYGRGGDPLDCHYEYRREVDYGSAAALMVRTDFWREIGGFDERFLPMYYEDTDLCFEARARGLKVMYEPRAEVIHVEGATAGVDESAGHKTHQERNRPKFVEKWRERLESEHLPNDQRNLWLGANLRRTPRVLVVDHRVPTWDRDSGGLRMRGIVDALLGLGAHVTFLPDNLQPMQPYTRELQRLGVEVLYGIDPTSELEKIGPGVSLVILSRPHIASRWRQLLREYAPQAAVVYDTVDLHWLREARKAAIDANRSVETPLLSPEVSTLRELELALIRSSDAALVVTEAERVQVQSDVPDAVVHVVPNVNQIRASVPPAAGRRGLLFVGGFEHPPNVDAALILVRDVLPHVWRELPDAPVTIVGADPPPEVLGLASPLVDVAGWVPDLGPLLDGARAMVAPLTYGAGLKGKITQSLAAGLPVVTTPIGAEGLDAVDGEQMLVAQEPEELAARAIRLLRDDELWSRLSGAGQRLAAELCSPAVMSSRMSELLENVERPASTSSLATAPVQTPQLIR